MKADLTPLSAQDGALGENQSKGLVVHRKPVRDWGCRFADSYYDLVTQVGEGTFRYSCCSP